MRTLGKKSIRISAILEEDGCTNGPAKNGRCVDWENA
jgi:hypothetical protein